MSDLDISLSPGLILALRGRAGVGKSRFAAALVAEHRHRFVVAADLTAPDQRRLAVQGTQATPRHAAADPTSVRPDIWGSWETVYDHLARSADVIVFDDVDRLRRGERGFLAALARAREVDHREEPPALILIIEDASLLGEVDDHFSRVEHIHLEPADFGAFARHCPAWSAEEVMAGYAVFGGSAARLDQVDPSERLSGNVSRLVLDPAGPLAAAPGELLRSRFQNPQRYASIAWALASGGESWKDLRQRVPGVEGSGPLAPYLARLEALDLVRSRRSLDSDPGSRRRRYGLLDPFDIFWWSRVLPLRNGLVSGALPVRTAWRDHIAPSLDDHVARVFPTVCRQFIGQYGLGRTGTRSREIGALWGDGYDIAVAGTLENGSVVYGACHWQSHRPTPSWLDHLSDQLRRTRYGFARESRIRLLFTREQPNESLRQALLRSESVRRIGPREMVSEARRI